MKTIVVATDGSAAALAAFASALELAEAQGAAMVVLHVAPGGSRGPGEAELLGGQEERARRRGVPCVTEVRDGDPADAILRRAAELDADLVALGANGRTAASGARLGSVSNRVLQRSERPVLIVRAGSGAGGA